MKHYILIFLFGFALLPQFALGQKTDTLIKKLDSLTKKTVDSGKQTNVIAPGAYNETTKINFKTFFVLLGSDFKQQVTAPFYFDKKSWLTFGTLTAATGALMFADKPIQQEALRARKYKPVVNISKYITNTGGLYESYTLGALAAYGFLFKNEKIKTTTYLAAQSYITAGVIGTVVKSLTSRERPISFDPNRLKARPRFHGPFASTGKDVNGKKTNGSFPSGHTTVAFAAATVYASEYKNRPIIPIISYTAASLIGLSRITENKHWTTDVFVGGVLGYFCGKQVVNNYHRYAKIQHEEKIKDEQPTKKHGGHASLNMQYFDGAVLPGIKYSLN